MEIIFWITATVNQYFEEIIEIWQQNYMVFTCMQLRDRRGYSALLVRNRELFLNPLLLTEQGFYLLIKIKWMVQDAGVTSVTKNQ